MSQQQKPSPTGEPMGYYGQHNPALQPQQPTQGAPNIVSKGQGDALARAQKRKHKK